MKRTLIFMVTNGAGLGHLTRGLAIAKRLRKMMPDLEIIFFSTSLALEMIRNEGFLFHYIPTQRLMPEGMNGLAWNNYMSRQLQDIIDIYEPIEIVYDGAHLYGGIIANIRQHKQLKSIWIKRECYKENTCKLEGVEKDFNLVIIPKEVDGQSERGDSTKRKYCNPILFLDREEAHERESVRKSLGIGKKETLFYVQLGAGNINVIQPMLEKIMACILTKSKNYILLGESPIGKRLTIKCDRIKSIRQYPNSQYFKGIDFAVSAAGYNTFNELIYFQVPTLYIPNQYTVKDDQTARALIGQQKEVGICLNSLEISEINKALDFLYVNGENFRKNAKNLLKENGADEAAHYILEVLQN